MFDFIKKFTTKVKERMTSWREYGSFRATFTSFGANIYASEIVRSCVRTLAEYTSKADIASSNKSVEMTLKYAPNVFMNGSELLGKIRTIYEIENTVFILMDKTPQGVRNFYPIIYTNFEVLKTDDGMLFIKFRLKNSKELIAAWDDLIVLRKDYYQSDIVGESNIPILNTLEMNHKADEALKNAFQSTANLRGVLKYGSTGGLSAEDLDAKKKQFIESYLSKENSGGIGVLDKNFEFQGVTLNPLTATWAQMKEYRENVYRYFGVNDKVIQSSMSADEAQVFYEAKIEPFLINLSLALSAKIFTSKQLERGAFVKLQSSAIQFISMTEKLNLKQYIDIGAITINEWRKMMNMAPTSWGDEPIRRLDTATIKEDSKEGKDE